MKKIVGTLLLSYSLVTAFGQASDSSAWEFSTDVNFYLIQEDYFILPVIRADHNKLHLEARYNYEDFQSFSGWVGYNFYGGKKLEYFITPMAGAVTGLTQGITTGLEITLNLKRFELYSESEYLFDSKLTENNFYYQWTDLTYSINDWLSVGLSAQRTRLYKTKLDIQRGLIIGASVKQWDFKGYLYNLGFDDPFGIVTATFSF